MFASLNDDCVELIKMMSEGVADMHCRSDEYLADELMLELKESQP